ncbi:NUDIX hydrolase [Gordonia alkaliphila]|uniref:NUDIX hydrolase n=1 Tax=Gordonia alkaliphila TaxID=1053547 RepID=UPI001FF5920D|nr:NUDIX hydrolase [Gordonia alkaliphila]MCK0439009.1 NUDIX hydrolase [Gordonia alkaliphila]
MSAESSVSRPDVVNDGPASADGQTPRSRSKRRGRRRGRRRGKGGGQNAAAVPSTTGQGDAARDNGGDQKNSQNQKKPSAPTGPKPSDLAGPRVRSEAGTPAAMPPTRRRPNSASRSSTKPASPAGGKTAETHQRTNTGGTNGQQPAQRLRTVRETSAGGLVLSNLHDPFDQLKAVLIGRIDRRGRMMWSLPKGHIETGETAETTAIREIAEETGVSGTVVATLGKIDYWFVSDGRRIHKTVHHYLLRYTGGELCDGDYEVSAVAWVPLSELPRRLTYSDERRLARTAEKVIEELRDDPARLAQSEAEANRTEPNDYEKAAAARNQRRNEPPAKPRRRRRRPRRGGAGNRTDGAG